VKRTIEVEGARRLYAGKPAVAGVDLTLEPGRITCLLGPSGCGKSTLLRLIAGLEPLDGGRIAYGGELLSGDGVHVPPEQREVGFVFQDYALFPHLTVAENVGFGLRRLPEAERRRRVAERLQAARLADRAGAYPHNLSGGEQQRIALARALAREPAAILLDEPFSGLDALLKSQVRDELLEMLRAAGAAVLVVTHDAEEALLMADRLALMQAGVILQVGEPREVYLRPVSIPAARMLGEVSALPGQAAQGLARTAFGDLACELEGAVRVAARPEAFVLSDQGVAAEVLDARFSGPAIVARLRAGEATATARFHPAVWPPGALSVRVRLDPVFCAAFAA